MKIAIAAALIAFAPVASYAQTPDSKPSAPTCTMAMDTALPAALADWTKPEALPAGANGATQPDITIGHAYKVQLSPVAAVQYPVAPKKLKDGSFGGLFMLTVDKAGTYTVAFDSGAWIDVIHDGQVVRSSTFGHGPDCSTIHKMVDFDLAPGHYTIEVSSAPKDTAVLMVVVKN
ncbi:homogentisate 1,2-dioxygenase [Asticcacaulis solisilvae]|uniref:homogentisate 1,2-dioxygenase n=1 Tax=Asticcacaulis solisilvae TaxID=1217274 RepID=UPI003FD78AC2